MVTPPRRARARPRTWLVGILLFSCVLSGYLLSFNVDQPAHNGDWFLRYQVTCSIVEHNSFSIRPYQWDARSGFGLQHHIYTQYTLGQSTAMIPLYLLGRLFAGLAHTRCSARIAPPNVLLTCKLLDPILGALLCVLFFATARLLGYAPRLALALTLLLAFATPLWPDVLSNLEHTQESLFLLVAAYAALRYTLQGRRVGRRGRGTTRLWVVVMGLAAGLVVVTRVAGVIVPPIFALYLLVLHRRRQSRDWRRPFLRDVLIFGAAVLPSLVLDGAYDLLRFGSPFRTEPQADHSFGNPPWLGLPDLLLSPGKGLLWYAPVLLLLVPAVGPFRRRLPLPATLFALISGVYLLFYANVTYWHGDPAWGPRYLYALLPYLMLPLGEIWRRREDRPRPARALIIAILAASVLVQLTAVSVSFWRQYHEVWGAHYDQVEKHIWGYNLNYWWRPDQSPIVVGLAGIADITQHYLDHAPLLRHAAAQWLGSGNESCVFPVFGRASSCLTHLDDLRHRANWNTFSMWWVHSYPWWPQRTVIALALALLAVCLASGAALVSLLTQQPERAVIAPTQDSAAPWQADAANAGQRVAPGPRPRRIPMPLPLWPVGNARAAATAATQPRQQGARPPYHKARLPGATWAPADMGLAAVGRAALVATLAYAGIMGAGALRTPHRLAPLFRVVPMAATVYDGSWGYHVLRLTVLGTLPGGLRRLPHGWEYAIVQLSLHNLATRPPEMKLGYFSLTNPAGASYPAAGSLDGPVAQLLHVSPLWRSVPPRSVIPTLEVYRVPDSARRFDLLGPGIALIRLGTPDDELDVPARASPEPELVGHPPLGPSGVVGPTDRHTPRLQIASPIAAREVVTSVPALRLRNGPSFAAIVIGLLPLGTRLRVQGDTGPWIAVVAPHDTPGYVFGRYVRNLR